jgi:hypothetical protein
MVRICSRKEAVIRKPHLFLKNVEQLPSVARVFSRASWQVAVGVLSGLRNALSKREGTIRAHY